MRRRSGERAGRKCKAEQKSKTAITIHLRQVFAKAKEEPRKAHHRCEVCQLRFEVYRCVRACILKMLISYLHTLLHRVGGVHTECTCGMRTPRFSFFLSSSSSSSAVVGPWLSSVSRVCNVRGKGGGGLCKLGLG